jgi:serine phosphatase RsbU (regulator of sigma subunit)/ligand-binding sensor domain-containing protein
MHKTILSRLIVFAFIVTSLLAQNQGPLQTISIPDGLSSPSVQYLYQDRFGYIWIMTEDGLNRYDGNKIKVYRNDPDDPASLFANNVWSAVEDKEGYLWIGGIGIASRYNYANEKFEVHNFTSAAGSERGRWIISLFTDSKGNVWAGTSGSTVHMLNRETGTFDLVYHVDDPELNFEGQIWCITQLKNGKILFSNNVRGLFQYDESLGKLTNYYLDKDFSPKNIIGIQEDDDGTIWFSGKNNIIHYNPNFYSYEVLEGLQILPEIYYLGYHKVNDENYIFVADPFGMIRYNPKTSKIIETIETRLNPYWFISDKFGIIWIAARGGVMKYDPNTMPFIRVQLSTGTNQDKRSNTLYNILPDNLNKQNIWSVAQGNNLINYNLVTGNSTRSILTLPEPFQNGEIDEVVQDKSGILYFSLRNSNGLLKYDPSTKEISKMTNVTNAFDSPFRTNDLAIDQNNKLFIASNQGISQFDLDDQKEFILPTTTNRKYSTDFISQVQKVLNGAKDVAIIKEANEFEKYNLDFSFDKETPVLIRCMGEGVIDQVGNLFDYGVLSSADGKIIYSMQNFYNTFNAGGGQKNRTEYKLLKLTAGKYNLKFLMDAGHSYNNFNTAMPADSVFYGIQVYQIDEKDYDLLKNKLEEELTDPSCMPIGIVRDVLVSRKYGNSIYLSTATQGLIRYNILTHRFNRYTFDSLENSNQKNFVVHSYEDISGNVWVSTLQGLIFLNPDNGSWRVFTEKDGLPSNTILRTIEDKNGDLWIISLGGLSKFNKSDAPEKWDFVNYDTRDGLSGYTFNGEPLRTPDGEILFIVGDELHRFTPRKSNPVKPDVVINDLKISDVSIFDKDAPIKLEKSLMEIGTINLSYYLNDLSFFFNVVHYSRPYKNKVFYKLEGFNDKWIEPELGSATFTNLDPGNYEFKVRAISADGVRNDEGASIKIIISPPWWQTTFAYISYGAFFILAVFSVDRFQRKRLLAKARERARIKESEMRAQIAESENERKTKELEEARQLQLSMLPKDLPNLPNLDIAVYMQTATEVGGDYYDFHVGLDGTLTVVIGDATGHGMKAGTMVTTTKSLFNILAPNPDILTTFSEISRVIKGMKFHQLSMCLMLLKIKGDQLFVSSAGMPPALIYRKKNRALEEIFMKGMPLGSINNFPYLVKESRLEKGDTILMVSDGLPELTNDNKEMYGYDRTKTEFHSVGEKEPEEIVNHLKNSASKWANGKEPDDDITFVVIKTK